jgi:hypothetical protein
MADEKKTYLVNVESNLAKYAQDAADAKKKVDELRTANDLLKQSGKASAAEIEANNAALRNAQSEYNKAKKLLDLQTQANNSNVNSRKQLGEIVRIEQLRLGALANQYTINSKGQRVLSDEYIKAVRGLKDAKDAVIAYDKAQSDGRSNIGRYGESVKTAFADIGKSLLGFTSVTAVAIAALEKLKDAFFSTEAGAKIMKQWTEGFKTFLQGIVTLESWKKIISGEIKTGAVSDAVKIAGQMDAIRVKQRSDLKEIAQLETDVKLLRIDAAKASLTEAQKLVILTQAEEKENQLIALKIANKQEELDVVNQMLIVRPKDTELLNQQAQLEADIITMRGEASLRLATQISTLTEKQIEAAKKRKEITDKEMQDLENLKIKNSEEALNQRAEIEAIVQTVREKTRIRTDELKSMEEYNKKSEDWTNSRVALSQWEREKYIADRQAAAGALSAMSEVVGSQTEAGKAFAVAAATINTWVAASQTLADPTIPSTFARVAMMVTVIATGLANVKNILQVNTRGKGTPSAPTSIASSIPVQRSFAQQTGSSILNQPQLSQSQLNSIPNQNLLTADDIARALQNMPAPVVTVEDINARSRAVERVNVRANI